jgi:hypothetical protein
MVKMEKNVIMKKEDEKDMVRRRKRGGRAKRLKVNLFLCHDVYGRIEVKLHVFLASALKWSVSRPSRKIFFFFF